MSMPLGTSPQPRLRNTSCDASAAVAKTRPESVSWNFRPGRRGRSKADRRLDWCARPPMPWLVAPGTPCARTIATTCIFQPAIHFYSRQYSTRKSSSPNSGPQARESPLPRRIHAIDGSAGLALQQAQQLSHLGAARNRARALAGGSPHAHLDGKQAYNASFGLRAITQSSPSPPTRSVTRSQGPTRLLTGKADPVRIQRRTFRRPNTRTYGS